VVYDTVHAVVLKGQTRRGLLLSGLPGQAGTVRFLTDEPIGKAANLTNSAGMTGPWTGPWTVRADQSSLKEGGSVR
jgi:hypothetical protein